MESRVVYLVLAQIHADRCLKLRHTGSTLVNSPRLRKVPLMDQVTAANKTFVDIALQVRREIARTITQMDLASMSIRSTL